MNEDTTQELTDNRSFEEKVLSALHDLDARLQRLEARAYDTKPIWERALAEIVDVKSELREINKRLDRIEIATLQNRLNVRELEERVTMLERHPH